MSLSVDLLLAFSLFAFVTSVTPGPNNTMLLASGSTSVSSAPSRTSSGSVAASSSW